jgi:hypothetical protein
MTPVICASCKRAFFPKAKGYNARYCADKCKRRAKRSRRLEDNPEQLRAARRRSYLQTKAHPERLKKHRDGGNQSRRLVRQWLADYKLARGCVDCGYRKHSAALQLDHEGPKSIEIADARTSIKRLQTEIDAGRCVVRCANCHSIRTAELKRKFFRLWGSA